jgi:hypothetical protein
MNYLSLFSDVSSEIEASKSTIFALNERQKELGGLLQIADLMYSSKLSTENIVNKLLAIIPTLYVHPNFLVVKIMLGDKQWPLSFNHNAQFTQKSLITDNDKEMGCIEVSYIQGVTNGSENPFLAEEQKYA